LRETKKSSTFAPASRNTLTSVNQELETETNSVKKQEEYVPRHIELTAVLREILKQKNKSNRIERFEKTTRTESNNNSLSNRANNIR
jgi:hypothetical protein